MGIKKPADFEVKNQTGFVLPKKPLGNLCPIQLSCQSFCYNLWPILLNPTTLEGKSALQKPNKFQKIKGQ